MAGDSNKTKPATREAAAASVEAPASLSGIVALISTETEAAIARQEWALAAALHAVDQRLQEVLTALPAARAEVDGVTDLGVALKALSVLLT